MQVLPIFNEYKVPKSYLGSNILKQQKVSLVKVLLN